jgi:SAM-dependent methyltransferase
VASNTKVVSEAFALDPGSVVSPCQPIARSVAPAAGHRLRPTAESVALPASQLVPHLRSARHDGVCADVVFEEPRLAAIYDDLDPDRRDLDVYLSIACELGARSVLDLGCGTGTFACALAAEDFEVTGIDPAAAMLAIARRKNGANQVTWIHSVATDLPPLDVDLATMTGNVAQVFLEDDE